MSSKNVTQPPLSIPWSKMCGDLYYVKTNKRTTIKKYFIVSYITIHRHVSVASATIIRVPCNNTKNVKINTKTEYLKPPDVTVQPRSLLWSQNVELRYCKKKKPDKINVFMLLLSCIYLPDTHTLSIK